MVTDHEPLVCIMDQQVLTRSQTRWSRLGLFQSIYPTIKYQPGKANTVANAFSKSQCKLEEGSMDDSIAAVAATIKVQILALSGVSRELTTKDLQRWAIAYKEDKGHVVAYMKLC